MNKPINLVYKETEDELVKIVNKSNLPAFILRYSFEKILNQLIEIEQRQLEETIHKYEENRKKQEEKNENNERI